MEERKPKLKRQRGKGIQPGIELSVPAAKIIRTAFRALMRNLYTGEPYRFSETMLEVIRKEPEIIQSLKKARKETQVVVGFEFARNGELDVNLLAPLTGTVGPEGKLERPAAPFMPLNMAGAANGTTHVKMISVAAELDLERGLLRMVNLMSAILPWQGTAATVLEQCHTVNIHGGRPIYLAVGMVWYRERSGVMFALKNGRFNPLTVVNAANKQNSWS